MVKEQLYGEPVSSIEPCHCTEGFVVEKGALHLKVKILFHQKTLLGTKNILLSCCML